MIPQVHIYPHGARSSREEISAFARGPRERRLRIWVDVESFVGREPAVSELLGFSENPNLEIDEIGLEQIRIDAEGDATVDMPRAQGHRRFFVRNVAHNIMSIRSRDDIDVVAGGELEKRLALMMCAERNTCDALVTASDDVLRIARRLHKACNAMSLNEAFAVLGLHLRLREDFVVRQTAGIRIQTTGDDFYLALGTALLAEAARWENSCPGPVSSAFETSPSGLARAVVVRMARALRARDRVHGHLFREATMASIDEAQFYFEGFLVALAAAFDSAARVVHRVYQLPSRQQASWRRLQWRQCLIASDADFGDILAAGSCTRATLDALFVLRNLIHEEPMWLVPVFGPGDRVIAFRAALPSSERNVFAQAVNILGGASAWSCERSEDDNWTLDLGRYVEALVPHAVDALNTLMRLTKIERFGFSEQRVSSPKTEDVATLRRFGAV